MEIIIKQTKVGDVLNEMSELEINTMIDLEVNRISHNDIASVKERINDYVKEYRFDYEPKVINGYKCYRSNNVDGVIITNLSNKLICIINEYEMCNIVYFEDVVLVPGRDSMTMFSTTTGVLTTEYIR